MSESNDDILLDAELFGDPDANELLGPSDDTEVLTDKEIRGCRLTLVRQKVHKVDLGRGAFGAIEIECSLLPAPGLRFASAAVIVKLEQPTNANFVDIAPTRVTRPGKMRFAFDAGAKLIDITEDMGVGRLVLKASREVDYEHCHVQGGGSGSRRVEWRFVEDDQAQKGILSPQALIMTVPVTGLVHCTVGFKAKIKRGGKSGAVRDLLFGRNVADRWRKLVVEIPQ